MKKNILFLFITAVLNVQMGIAQPPTWQWVKAANSSGEEMALDASCHKASGDVWIGGYFNGNLSSTYGASFSATYGNKDGFAAKYDQAGNFITAFKVGGSSEEMVQAISVDATGNVYIAGYFNNTADFDPSSGTANLTAVNNRDGFLAKYNSSGVYQWAVKIGGNDIDEVHGVYADANGVYITGHYRNSATFFSTNATTMGTTSTDPAENFFGAKYSTSGVVQWAVSGASIEPDEGNRVVADNNNVYFIGSYKRDFTLYNANGTAATTVLIRTPNKYDAFIAAYTQSGTLAWATNACSPDDDEGKAITQDATHLYIAGHYRDVLDFPYPSSTITKTNGGSTDYFVAKISKTTGAYVWAKTVGSNNDEEEAYGVEMSNYGKLVVTGMFKNSMDFSSVGGGSINSSGGEDVFFICFDAAGNFQWVDDGDGNGKDYAYCVTSSNIEGFYIAGEHADGITFGSYSIGNAGNANIYVAKIGCNDITATSISAAQNICSGTAPATLTGTVTGGNTPYTYLWEQSTDNVSWTAAAGTNNTSSYNPPALTSNTYYRRTVFSGSGCNVSLTSTSKLITVTQPPTTSAAGADQDVCATTATLAANLPTTGTGTWTLISGSGTIVSPALPNTGITGLGVGNNTFRWTIANSPCPSSMDDIIVTRWATPTTSNAGPNQTVCSTSAIMAANTPATGSGNWTLISGSGTITSPSSPNTTITGLGAGANVFRWTITNGVCTPSFSDVTITRDLPPTTATAGADQTICSTTATLNANLPSVGSGMWTLVSGTGTIVTPASPNTNVTGLGVGPNVFRWTISNGVCPSSMDEVTITRDEVPTTSIAGSDQVICSPGVSLSGNTPSVGTGTWTLIAGAGIITSPNSPASSISGLGIGSNTFRWTIANGVCPTSMDEVTITRDSEPTIANAGTDQTICNTGTTLSGNAASIGTGTWTLISGGGNITSPNSPTSSITSLGVGTNVFRWTIANGVCPASIDEVIIIRDDFPSSSFAGSDQTLCSGSTTLTANTPSVGNGVWTVAGGTGTFNNSNFSGTGVNNLSIGANIFVWTISNGVCPAEHDTVQITRDAMPTPSNAGPDQWVCASTATLNGNSPSTGSGVWIQVTGISVIGNPASPATSVSGLAVGSYKYAWVISNGTCPSAMDTVMITRDPMPTPANAGADTVVCATTSVFNANAPSIGNGVWTNVSGSGFISNPNSPGSAVSSLAPGLNIFEWKITSGVCPPSRDTVIVQRDQEPTLSNAGTDQAICSPNGNLSANIPVIGNGTWTLVSGNGTINNPSQQNSGLSSLDFGSNYFVWTIANGICPASSDTVIITRDTFPTNAVAGTDQTLCDVTTPINANTPTSGTGQWILASGTGNVNDPYAPNTSIDAMLPGTHILIWTIINGSCPPSADTLIVNVDDFPSPANAGTDLTICDDSFNLMGNDPVIGTGTWSIISGTGNLSAPNQYNGAVQGLSIGQNILRWTISNGTCPDSFDEVIISQDEAPTPAIAGADMNVDFPVVELAANTPTVGTGYWTVETGIATLSNPADPNSEAIGLQVGSNIFKWTTTNGVCPRSEDVVIIYMAPFTIPNGFSPNEDNINDYFVVPELEYYPNVQFTVFNRWGAEVYASQDYKNDWKGVNQSNQPLADDTYYFTLHIIPEMSYSGFIVIKRNLEK